MTTLSDLGVTPAKLRAYGHDGNFEALTGPQLQGVCCWAKSQLDIREGKFKRWSKSTAREMRGIGIKQDPRSGEPSITYRKAKVVDNISVSLEDFNRVEDELQKAQETIQQLQDAELLKSKPGGFTTESNYSEHTSIIDPKVFQANPGIRTLHKKEFLEEASDSFRKSADKLIKSEEFVAAENEVNKKMEEFIDPKSFGAHCN